MDTTELLLKEITEANGVSGYEDEVRRIMARELKGSVSVLKYDKMGSIMGLQPGTAANPRVMVVGHMDEIGFMVKEITDDGYIRFLPLGGWWGHVALGQRMRIITSNGPVLGVVGSRPPHILEQAQREKVLEIKDMFIDVGVVQKFDVKKKLGIKQGDPIIPDSQFTILGNKKLYMAKAFDNRVACAIVVEVSRRLKKIKHPNTFLASASVQEEVGLRGAQTLGWLGEPDICLVVDTGIALDVPPESTKKAERLGGGPAILLYDAGMIPNQKLRDLVMDTAKKAKIPFHVTTMERGATDGGRIHISRVGVPSIVIGPPVRYIHSHNAILHRDDYDNTIKLLVELIKRLDAKTVKSFTQG
ncbi:MAG: M42 family metallopeptidase [candidate division Zixibacteria bacterium]|nr:M42 family metallopeptidase [candidate division Zixibacteria bacterium]